MNTYRIEIVINGTTLYKDAVFPNPIQTGEMVDISLVKEGGDERLTLQVNHVIHSRKTSRLRCAFYGETKVPSLNELAAQGCFSFDAPTYKPPL